jgi:hypothetical protein
LGFNWYFLGAISARVKRDNHATNYLLNDAVCSHVPQWNDPDIIGFQIQRAVGGDPIRNLLFLNVQQASTNDSQQGGSSDFGWTDPDVSTFKRLITNSLTLPISVVPNLVGGNTGVVVRYVVYAKYIDGAMSPLANITVTW